jgi:urea transport system permease protein
VLFVVFPVLHLAVPADSAWHLSAYTVTLIGKIMCYAIVALAMDLIWGYTGILSLGTAHSPRSAATRWACT